MKIRHLFSLLLPVFAVLAACTPEEKPIADIIVKVDPSDINVEGAAVDRTVQLTATRAWKATVEYEGDSKDWISISPSSASASASARTITLTFKENTGRDRKARIVFNIGLDQADLKVTQTGPKGSAEPVYFNNFDKTAATQTYGNGKWPMPSESDCWKNETGTGASTVSYVSGGNKATIRNNSNSSGSGVNNWFFGADSFFCVEDITLPQSADFTLSFLGIRNVYGTSAGDGNSIFDHGVFKVYVSADTKKWVEIQYAFEGGDPDNTWAEAASTFTVPAGTEKLSFYIPTPSETSVYRIDDFMLDVADAAGTAIDFSQGVEIEVGDDSTSGGGTVDPDTAQQITVDEFVKKADDKTFYKLVGKVSAYKYDKYMTFDLTDDSGTVYVYKVTNQTDYKDTIKDGGIVTLVGKYAVYNGKAEVVDAQIVNFEAIVSKEVETEKIADVLAAQDSDVITLKNALVVADGKNSYLVTDTEGKDYMLVFYSGTPTERVPSVGDKVTVEATKATYSGMPQLTSPKTTIVSSGNAVSYPAAEDISGTLDSFESTVVKYVSFTGNLALNGNYYNVTVPGASTCIGCFVAPSFDITPYVDVDAITYEGFYIYKTGGKYVYLILTKAFPSNAEFFNVPKTEYSVTYEATSVDIALSGNVAWTAGSDTPDFKLDKTSGEGDATIKVTFPANTAFEARTATVTISTTADVAKKSYSVTISQGAAPDPDAKFIELTNAEITAALANTSIKQDTYSEITMSSAGGDWTGNVNGRAGLAYAQIRNSQGAYLKTPLLDSDIEKIEINAYAIVAGTSKMTRTVYVIPADTELDTTDKTKYNKDEYPVKIASIAYGGPEQFIGTEKVEIVKTLKLNTAGVRQCKIICYDGTLYINSVKVYLKK